jgi:thioredoxin reductase
MNDAVLIIGAGPAGIAQAYFLQQAGIPYRLIDRAEVVGETWAHLYPSLRLNTTRYFSHMPGKPFPWHYGVFPTGRQYHAYLTEFVREQGIQVELGVEVTRLTPSPDSYCVETNRDAGVYRDVVLATGRFSQPYTPRIPVLDAYTGAVMHAHEYRDPAEHAGKRVLVVGNGPSGMDISIEIGRHNAPTHPALLAMRTGIVLRRRYPLGLSKHAWLIVTRWLPERLSAPLLDALEHMGYRESALRGIKTPPPGLASSSAATRGPELIHAVRDGVVICVGEPLAADGQRIQVAHLDGETRWHEVDLVILATGYRPALDFLDGIPYEADDQGWPLRENSQPYTYSRAYTYDVGAQTDARLALLAREIRGFPGLFVQGLFYKGKGTLYNINVEAAVISEQIAQRRAAAVSGTVQPASGAVKACHNAAVRL